MSKPKVFLTRPILESGLQLVHDFCEAEIWSGEFPHNRDELLRCAVPITRMVCCAS